MDYLGWIANFVVIYQFLQRDMFKLRVWGFIGAFLWCIYGWLLESIPLISMNIVIMGIQVWGLRELSIEKKRKNPTEK